MLITGPKKLFTWKNENYRTSLHDLNVMKKESVNQAMGKEKALSSPSTLILYNKLSIFLDPMSHDHKSREKGTVSDSSQMSLCIFLVLYVILKGHLTHSSCSDKSSYSFSDNYCDSTSALAYLKITWGTCLVVYSWVQPLEILIQQIRGRWFCGLSCTQPTKEKRISQECMCHLQARKVKRKNFSLFIQLG